MQCNAMQLLLSWHQSTTSLSRIYVFLLSFVGILSCSSIGGVTSADDNSGISVERFCNQVSTSDGLTQIVSDLRAFNPPAVFSLFGNEDQTILRIDGLENNCSAVLSSSLSPMTLQMNNIRSVFAPESSPFYERMSELRRQRVAECQLDRGRRGLEQIVPSISDFAGSNVNLEPTTFCGSAAQLKITELKLFQNGEIWYLVIVGDEVFFWEADL